MNRVRRLSSPSRKIVYLGIALLLGSMIASAVALRQIWLTAQEEGRQQIHSLGAVLAQQTAQSLRLVAAALDDLCADVVSQDVGTPAQFKEKLGSEKLHHALRLRLNSLNPAEGLSLISASGQLVNNARGWPPPPTDLSDRDYFKHARDTPGTGLYISAPVRNRGNGTLVFYLSQRISAPDGSFLGLITGSLPLSEFEALYRSLKLYDGVSVSVHRLDGIPIMAFPSGTALTIGNEWQRVALAGGEYQEPGAIAQRFVSVHRVPGFDLTVDVSLTPLQAFGIVQHQLQWFAGMVLIGIACQLGLLRALIAQFDRLERSRVDLVESQARLAEKSAALDIALENMDQGLLMMTPERVVAVCNRRAMEMLDLPPALMASQPKFDEVIQYQWLRGDFQMETAAVREFVRSGGVLSQPHSYERVGRDGRRIEISSVPLQGGGVVRTYTDVTERRAAQERLTFIAHHDDLTGLPNRLAFRERLAAHLTQARAAQEGLAILYIDLDRFKLVNDTRGHTVGDALLNQLGQRLLSAVRSGDVVSRFGGDEFAVLLSHTDGRAVASWLAEQIMASTSAPYVIDGEASSVGLSIGVAVFPGDGDTADDLLRAADSALYHAKRVGRGNVRFHEQKAQEETRGKLLLEQQLRLAIERNEMRLAYQPIFDVATGRPAAFEALVRWHHPDRGVIPPSDFIPLAEESGQIGALGRWVLETACREAAGWPGPAPPRISVNLSPAQFRQPDLNQQIGGILLRTGLAPNRLDLEVTEGVLLAHTDAVRSGMQALRTRGIRLVLDDFGTAHASLSYLLSFPFQQLKIDKSFIWAMGTDTSAKAIVEAVLVMARAMRLDVVAEGVETEAQMIAIRALGCGFVQGFLLGRPESPETIREIFGLPHPGPTTAEKVDGADKSTASALQPAVLLDAESNRP